MAKEIMIIIVMRMNAIVPWHGFIPIILLIYGRIFGL